MSLIKSTTPIKGWWLAW